MEGRIPPHSEIAEQSLLGAMILDGQAINDAIETVNADAFYNRAHAVIYAAIMTLYNGNKPVDLITLSDNLSADGKLDAVGGLPYLTNLTDKGILTTNAKHYAEIVDEKYTLRQLIKVSSEIIESGYGEDDTAEIIEQAERKIFDITQRRNREGFTHIGEVMQNTITHISTAMGASGELTGTTTGLADLDSKTQGLQRSDLVLLAARPSMGKTALGLNICKNAAVKKDAVVAMFSLEMAKEQYVQRMMAAESLVSLTGIRTGHLSQDEWPLLVQGVSRLSNANIYIDDTPAITVSEVRAKCRRLKIEHGLDIVLIDYLQLMSGGKAESRQQEISNISRGLKALARELDCPVLALSQLSRAPEQRADHRPMLSDLRESGAIEQDADIVMFLYRDEYYFPEKEDNKNVAELIIGKQRNGETGTIKLHWLGQFQLFRDLEERYKIWA